MPTTYRLDTHRPLPAGCGQQDRHPTRGHGTEQEPDTIVTDWDDLGAGRGCVEDCTDYGALDDAGHRMPEPSAAFLLACAVAIVAILAACAVAVRDLPLT